MYVASDAEPAVVYEAGNGALIEYGFFSLVGLGMVGCPFVRRYAEERMHPSSPS